MKHILLFLFLLVSCSAIRAQSCAYDSQILTADSVLCAGDSTTLTFSAAGGNPADSVLPTPVINNNGQDGNMFDITATNTIRIRYFEALIANTPNPTTTYYIYYKVGTHVGFESNSAAWTQIAGPITLTVNAPPVMTVIPANLNLVIPAGQTYAFYLTNTSAATNNNRYHNGTATGNVAATNADLTLFEGTGGAYPFGTFFNARPWEGIVHYDYPPVTYLWNTGATSNSITVQPATTTSYSCLASVNGGSCFVEDTITVQVNPVPAVALGPDSSICQGEIITFDAGNAGSLFSWCSGETSQAISVGAAGAYCVSVTDANGCSGADTISVTVDPLPFLTTTSDSICSGETGTITAGGSATSYEWDSGTFSGSVVNDSPTVTTFYTVVATDVNGCTATGSAIIIVSPLPVFQATGDTICAGSTAMISASGNASAYDWQPGSLPGDSLSVTPSATTTYTVTAFSAAGCTAVDSALVIVNALPSLTLLGDSICEGSAGIMYATGSASMYSWNPGNFTGPVVTDSPLSTTTYTVTATDANGCQSADVVTMVVNSLPSVSVSSFGTHCVDDGSFQLTGGSPAGGSYSGPGVSGGTFSPVSAGNGTHAILYTYTDANGCAASASSNVVIDLCTGIVSQSTEGGISIYPNPFHESAVIVFDERTVVENALLEIVDMSGKVVMSIPNINSTNVMINRGQLANGVYFYRLINKGATIGTGKLIVN
jgi:hypothetical protein